MKKIHSLSFSLPRGDQTADSTREEASCRKKRLDPLSETSGCLALGRRLHIGKIGNLPSFLAFKWGFERDFSNVLSNGDLRVIFQMCFQMGI